jgi:PAS domain S-box-containing protein
MSDSLLKRLAFSFLLLSVGPLLVAGGVITARTFAKEKEFAFRLHQEKAFSVSLQVEDFVRSARARIDLLGMILANHVGRVDRQRMYMLMVESRDYNDLTLADGKGEELIRLSRYQVVDEGDLKSIADDQSFLLPKETGDAYFSPIVFHPTTREPLMTISIPIVSPVEGAFEGVLKVEVRLKRIWGSFEKLAIAEQQTIYLVNEERQIIAHPNFSTVLKGVKSSLTGARGIGTSHQGGEVLFTIRDFMIGRNSFAIIVETPARVALRNAYRTLQVLLFTLLLSLGIAVLLLRSSGRSIIMPLKALLEGVNRMKEGVVDQRVAVQAHDEIGMLTQSFNEMTAALSRELADRLRAESALRESEERYRLLFSSGNDAIFVHGFKEDGMPSHFIEVNQVACERLGYDREELLKLSPLDIDDPEMLARMPQTMEDVHRKKQVIFEMLHRARDGRRIPVEISSHEFILDGTPHLLSIARDISERKDSQLALQRSHETFRTVLDSQEAIVYVADMESYEILFINDYARLLFGDVTGEICWKTLQQGQTGPCDFCTNKHLLDDEGKPTGVYTWELRNTVSDRWYELRDRAIEWIDGRTVRFEIGVDITERKKLEDQLRHAQKMEAIGTLTGGIAHDFNNILTAITGYGELIREELDKDDPLRTYAEIINSSADKAARLTQSLLAFSRRQLSDPRPVKMNAIISKAEGLLSRIITEDIEIVTSLSERDPTIMADGGQVEQVLMNLASNAKAAMPGGGRLQVGTDVVRLDDAFVEGHGGGKSGEYALILVSDTGSGMDRETREKIFEPFFTTKEAGKGTGLGLAVVYGIVRQHGGFVDVYSEPGDGTTFRIYFPLTGAAAETETRKSQGPLPGGTETILVAEDNEQIRRLLKTSLERVGYKVLLAVDGEDAIREYDKNKGQVDLLILDVIMPKKDGRKVYDEIGKTSPGIKALFMSGYSADIVENKGSLPENTGYISKPISLHELLMKVRERMDREGAF